MPVSDVLEFEKDLKGISSCGKRKFKNFITNCSVRKLKLLVEIVLNASRLASTEENKKSIKKCQTLINIIRFGKSKAPRQEKIRRTLKLYSKSFVELCRLVLENVLCEVLALGICNQ